MNNNSKTIVKNSGMLYVRMAISLLVGLYTSRVILDALGIVDFGIYNVVGGLTTMFMFLNSSMAVSTSRFLSYEIGRNDTHKLSLVYQQAVIIHIIIALIIFLLIETLGQWFLYNKLVIPDERLDASFWVLHTVAFVAVLNVLSTPDMSLIIAHEKMSSFAYISLLDVFLKLFIAISLSHLGGDKLIVYSILLMTGQLSIRLIYYIYSKRTFVETTGKMRFSKNKFKEMLSFASWNLLGNIALMTIDQGVNIMLNMFCGPVVNAARGIANQISNVVTNFTTNIRMAINPQITKSYSIGDYSYMHSLIKYSSISCFYLILFIGFPLFWIGDYLLDIWLVEVPEYAGIFFRYTLLYLMVNSFANPIIIGVHATGKIIKFQLIEGFIMLLTLPCAWMFLEMGWPPYSVYVAQIMVGIYSQLGRLYVVLPIIGMTKSYYIREVLYPCFVVLFISVIVPTLLSFGIYRPLDWRASVLMAFISALWSLLVIFFCGLKNEERALIRSYLIKFINRE